LLEIRQIQVSFLGGFFMQLKFIRNQQGQSIMEYVILTGLIGLLAMSVVKQFGTTLKTKVEQSSQAINRTISIR
jgi:Flp pilus assembly pilin Flp